MSSLYFCYLQKNNIYRDPKKYTGNFEIDEEVLKQFGISDMTPYACDPSKF